MEEKKTEERAGQLLQKGMEKGSVTPEEVLNAIADTPEPVSKLESILNELEEHSIQIMNSLNDEPDPTVEDLANEEEVPREELAREDLIEYIPEGINVDDPVKM